MDYWGVHKPVRFFSWDSSFYMCAMFARNMSHTSKIVPLFYSNKNLFSSKKEPYSLERTATYQNDSYFCGRHRACKEPYFLAKKTYILAKEPYSLDRTATYQIIFYAHQKIQGGGDT